MVINTTHAVTMHTFWYTSFYNLLLLQSWILHLSSVCVLTSGLHEVVSQNLLTLEADHVDKLQLPHISHIAAMCIFWFPMCGNMWEPYIESWERYYFPQSEWITLLPYITYLSSNISILRKHLHVNLMLLRAKHNERVGQGCTLVMYHTFQSVHAKMQHLTTFSSINSLWYSSDADTNNCPSTSDLNLVIRKWFLAQILKSNILMS